MLPPKYRGRAQRVPREAVLSLMSDWTEEEEPVGHIVDMPNVISGVPGEIIWDDAEHARRLRELERRLRNRQPLDPIEIISENSGPAELWEGHHRAIAAQRTRVPYVYVIESREDE